MGAPIGGGKYHDTLAVPGAGDVVIAGTKGNDVTFAAAQYYDGSTTVREGAVLRLGSAQGDGSLLTGTDRRRIVNDGSLVVRNTKTAISLSRLGGSGSLVQSGAATTTLTGAAVTYTGTTTVERGTLALRGGATLANSRAVRLTSTGARLDTGGSALRVTSALSGKGTVNGAVTNEGVVKGGLTVTGAYTQNDKGQLVLADKPLKVGGKVTLSGGLDLSAVGTATAAPGADSASGKSSASTGTGNASGKHSPAAGNTSAREITVLNHTGDTPTTGSFDQAARGSRGEARRHRLPDQLQGWGRQRCRPHSDSREPFGERARTGLVRVRGSGDAQCERGRERRVRLVAVRAGSRVARRVAGPRDQAHAGRRAPPWWWTALGARAMSRMCVTQARKK